MAEGAGLENRWARKGLVGSNPTLSVPMTAYDLLVGLAGQVVAIDATTGAERWRTKLTRSNFVQVARDENRIYAASAGQLFCLDPSTGAILWRNSLKGLGYGIASLLPPGAAINTGSGSAAEIRARAQRAGGAG